MNALRTALEAYQAEYNAYLVRFRAAVDNFLLSHPTITPTDLGVGAVHDPSFVFELRNGRRPTLPTIEKVECWMGSIEANATQIRKPRDLYESAPR